MHQVPESEIKKRLAFDNPWWEEGAVDKRFRAWPRRAYLEGFIKLVAETAVRRAVVLMGPRRVGKTVMIHQAVQHLLDKKVAATRIFYVSVDTPVYTGLSLERLLHLFQDIHDHGRREPLYVFYDEIQYHKDWEIHLKSLVDSYPSVRFVASGSAAAALKLKSSESGAGRFTDFLLPSLTFHEFIWFGKREELKDLRLGTSAEHDSRKIDALNSAFVDYLNFGGFPEAVVEEGVRERMDRYIADDIIDKVLLRDIPSLYGIADVQELKRFFTTLAYNTGQEVSINELSQTSQVAKNTLKKYLDYLEAAFLIARMYRVDQNARRFKKQNRFKVYLTNACLRAALFGAVGPDDPAMGPLAETALVGQFVQGPAFQWLHYARWKTGEVDLVMLSPSDQSVVQATEVKWSDRAFADPAASLRGLAEFCRKARMAGSPLVCTRTVWGSKRVDGTTILFVPVSFECYRYATHLAEMTFEAGFRPRSWPPISVLPAGGA
jgi:predicted AAA+ superfamily ATPase